MIRFHLMDEDVVADSDTKAWSHSKYEKPEQSIWILIWIQVQGVTA